MSTNTHGAGKRASVRIKRHAARVQATKEELLRQVSELEAMARAEGDPALADEVNDLLRGLIAVGVGNVLKRRSLLRGLNQG